MSELVTRKHRCCECGTLHDFYDDAATCCVPQVEEVFVCLDCGDWHRVKHEAEACCCDGDPDERQPQLPALTIAQLEALGQLRLVP